MKLYQYQKEGVAWITSRPETLLADEMGLGKTVQVIVSANLTNARDILIVCPTSLTWNWQNEFETWGANRLTFGIVTGREVPKTNVVAVSYDLFVKHREELKARQWDMVVLDEAQYIKTPDTQRARAILGWKLEPALDGKRKIALTGTPIENRPIEIYNILRWLNPKRVPNRFRFAAKYCGAHVRHLTIKTRGGKTVKRKFWDFSRATNLETLEKKLRATVMLRRLKSEVMAELPAKVKQLIEIEVGEKDYKLIEKVTHESLLGVTPERFLAEIANLETPRVSFDEMSSVRKMLAISKINPAIEHLERCLDGGGKVIAFVHHSDVAYALEKHFGERAVVFTGETSPAGRKSAVERFQNDSSVRLFIGNIEAAGVGITLTAASHVVFVEMSWVPGKVAQAEDRAHRIGQHCSVLCQYLVVRGSIDALMARYVIHKEAIIEKALNTQSRKMAEMLS